jgi:UDPglucose--hexose-1-phosphate uridylyltransferase
MIMKSIEFKKEFITARIRNPLKNFELSEEKIEVRHDPLTGRTMRISKPKGLDKFPDGDPLNRFASEAKPCFFCAGKVETTTPMMPQDILEAGRIQVGEAFLFPNLSGFGEFSAVCIFSKKHFIAIDEFTATQILNALKACQQYFTVISEFDQKQLYPSLNGNYLLPAGSSILHPHLQPFLDSIPTNYHRDLLISTENFYDRYNANFWEKLKHEEKDGERFLFEIDDSFFFTPYAPMGFNEICGIIGNGESFPDLSETVLQNLAQGIRNIFQFYHDTRHDSFNVVLFSPPINSLNRTGFPCFVRICTRPAFTNFYRNDVTFFEKYHLETMIDKSPEQVAEEFRKAGTYTK